MPSQKASIPSEGNYLVEVTAGDLGSTAVLNLEEGSELRKFLEANPDKTHVVVLPYIPGSANV